MLNLKMGPAFALEGLDDPALLEESIYSGYALQLDWGAAVTRDCHGYIVFSPGFSVGGKVWAGGDIMGQRWSALAVFLPVGFQYEIPLPVLGLYLYPRITAGYAAVSLWTPLGHDTQHLGLVEAAIGLKYVLRRRWNFAIEFLDLPVLFWKNESAIWYRVLLVAGVNF